MERMGGDEFTKKIYMSGVDAVGVRGRPPIKWEDGVLEYLRERRDIRLRGMESSKVKCMDRSNGDLCCGHCIEGATRNKCQSRLNRRNLFYFSPKTLLFFFFAF